MFPTESISIITQRSVSRKKTSANVSTSLREKKKARGQVHWSKPSLPVPFACVYDSETNLYYLQARYYDSDTARFLSRDPDIGDADDPVTMNGYTYADDNPVMMTDPDGHWAWVVINAGFAAYDGYRAYKAGKSKKQIAWAVAWNYIKFGKIARIARFAKGKVKTYEQARNRALFWLGQRGFKSEKQTFGKFGYTKNKPIGRQTNDGKVGFRIEYDSRSGAHINIWAGKEKGPHLEFGASEKTVKKIQKRF